MRYNLKISRMIKGMRQVELAKKLGISQGRLSLIENGFVKPTEAQKRKIEEILGMKVKWNE